MRTYTMVLTMKSILRVDVDSMVTVKLNLSQWMQTQKKLDKIVYCSLTVGGAIPKEYIPLAAGEGIEVLRRKINNEI